jgi:NAD+ synthase (glutamine-hydrolysing)
MGYIEKIGSEYPWDLFPAGFMQTIIHVPTSIIAVVNHSPGTSHIHKFLEKRNADSFCLLSFTAWVKERQTEKYYLEEVVRKVTGQHTIPIGDVVLSTLDTAVGCETCEELFTPLNPSTYMGLNGVEIILNSSASHAELRKLRTRLDLISNSTRKVGGVYVYANATGVDGEARMMYDGSSMIVANGKVLEQGSQFSLKDVEVTTATFDIEEVRSFRSSISRNVQAAAQPEYERVECELRLSRPADQLFLSKDLEISKEIEIKVLDPMEEIYMSTAVFLWQYLVRSRCWGRDPFPRSDCLMICPRDNISRNNFYQAITDSPVT